MPRTDSEKMVEVTLRLMALRSQIAWWLSLEPKVMHAPGGKTFRAPAPIDFLVGTGTGRGGPLLLEIKERIGTYIDTKRFAVLQREILRTEDRAYCVLKFCSSRWSKRSAKYWEHWYLVPGCLVPAASDPGMGIEALRDHEIAPFAFRRGRFRSELLSKEGGVNRRGRAVPGLTRIPFPELGPA